MMMTDEQPRWSEPLAHPSVAVREVTEEEQSPIPATLTERPQWVAWAYETRDRKRTKVPYQPGAPMRRASATDPGTLGTHAEAVAAALAGVGFVLTAEDPFAGVDLDDCLRGGALHPAAALLVARLGSYAEWSPGGAGVHVFLRGCLPGKGRAGVPRGLWGGKLELYDRARFLTVTGRRLGGAPADVRERQAALDYALGLLPGPPAAGGPVWVPADDIDPGELIPDGELLNAARHEPGFARLWDERPGPADDWSALDFALCTQLATWALGDRARIERLWGESALGDREKWRRRPDYRRRTIDRAVEAVWG
jgi:putative DNA primase/helicase